MSESPLALRPGQTGWETEMWARAFVALVLDGTPPPEPLLVPPGAEEELRASLEAYARKVKP